MNGDLTLRIDRLVLDGLDLNPGEERLIRAALEAELARLLAEGGLGSAWAGGGAVPDLRAADIPAGALTNPAALGRQIARSIYAGLGRDANPPPQQGSRAQPQAAVDGNDAAMQKVNRGGHG